MAKSFSEYDSAKQLHPKNIRKGVKTDSVKYFVDSKFIVNYS